jgi:hypothetical protein
VPANPAGIAVVPILDFAGGATNNYQLTGLPDPVAGGQGVVVILSATGEMLREYAYSLPPTPPVTVYRTETVVTGSRSFTAGDTIGAIELAVKGMPNPTGKTATFSLRDSAGTLALSSRPASISAIVHNLSNDSWDFLLTYALEVGHPIAIPASEPLGSSARLRGEFHLDYGSGLTKYLPGDASLLVLVRRVFS